MHFAINASVLIRYLVAMAAEDRKR
jgi:hypothetical protein